MNLPINYRVSFFKEDISWEKFFSTPPITVPQVWGTGALKSANSWLAKSNQYLYFGFQLYSANTCHFHESGFHQGLWNYDVAELFLSDFRSEKYWELNITPSKAYWQASFVDYRQVLQSRDFLSVPKIFSLLQHDHWQVAIAIPWSEIGIKQDNCCFNVAAITGEGERKYFSLAPAETKEPDFHRLVKAFKLL